MLNNDGITLAPIVTNKAESEPYSCCENEMELRHLRYFVAVADCKSFSEAAKRLFISQPSLSRQIKQLEEEMGIELIDRTQRPLILTETGEFFYDQAILILAKAVNLKTMTQRMANFKQTLSIGFESSILYGILPRVIATFRKYHPHVEVKLYELSSRQQVDELKKGLIDVGFGRLRFEDSSVQRLVLREENLVVAIPRMHPLAQDESQKITLGDLVEEHILLYPKKPRPSFMDQVLEQFEQRNLAPNYYREVRELQIAIGLVAAGEGITIVPKTVSHVRNNEIRYLSLADDSITSPIVMSTRKLDSSKLLSTLLEVTYQNYDKLGFFYQRESI